MKVNYFMIWGIFIGIISGCSSPVKDMRASTDQQRGYDKESFMRMYRHDLEEASKRGYKEGLKQGAGAAIKMNGEYVWRPYKVENVLVPARVVNGIFYGSHEEEVIVRPTSIDREYADDGKGE